RVCGLRSRSQVQLLCKLRTEILRPEVDNGHIVCFHQFCGAYVDQAICGKVLGRNVNQPKRQARNDHWESGGFLKAVGDELQLPCAEQGVEEGGRCSTIHPAMIVGEDHVVQSDDHQRG